MAETEQWAPLAPAAVKVSEPIRRDRGWGQAVAPCLTGRTEAAAQLGGPRSKLLAVGALSRREGPGAPAVDLRRGGSGLLGGAGKYNGFVIF